MSSINIKVIRIREMVAGEKRTPRRMALTDFPRNYEVAKVVTDWSSALDFIDKYADRAKEWWNQLLDRLRHDDYDKPAGLIDRALGAVPLPASRRGRGLLADRFGASLPKKLRDDILSFIEYVDKADPESAKRANEDVKALVAIVNRATSDLESLEAFRPEGHSGVKDIALDIAQILRDAGTFFFVKSH